MEGLVKINKVMAILIAACFRYVSLYYSSTLLNFFLIFVLFLIVLFNILNKKFERKQFQIITILILISAVIFLLNNEDSLFIYAVAALAFIDEKQDSVIKWFLICCIASFIITIFSGQLGIIENKIAGRYIDYETVYRSSLGFGNVNTPFIYYMGIIFGLYYFFGKDRKKLFLIYVISSIIAFWLFKETNCRTGIYIYILFIGASLIYSEKMNNKIQKYIPYLFIIFTFFSIALASIYGNTIHNYVNEVLSNRPYFSNYYLKNHEIFSLFGTSVTEGYVLDNYYISLMVKTGLISYFIYFYIFYKGGTYLKKDYRLVLIIIFTLIYGIFECNLYGNFIFLLLIVSIIKGKEVKYD